MSGDRILKTPLLSPKIPAEGVEESDFLKKTAKPIVITVTANGHKIQSSLNPNALEFIPSYVQRIPQITLNEKIYNEIVRKQSVYIEHDFVTEKLQTNKKLESNCSKMEESMFTQDRCQDLRNFAGEKKNENVNKKLEMNMVENQVFVLFTNSSAVVNTSSETVRSVLPASEIEKYALDIQEEKHYDKKEGNFERDLEAVNVSNVGKIDWDVSIQDTSQDIRIVGESDKNENMDIIKLEHNVENIQLNVLCTNSSAVVNNCSETVKSILPVSEIENSLLEHQKEEQQIDRDCKNRENELSNEKNVLEENIPRVKELENLQLENFNESNMSNPKTKDKTNKTEQDCEKDLIAKIEDKIQNIKNSNETAKVQHNVAREVNESKKKLNINSKIARLPKPTTTGTIGKPTNTGTIRRVSLTKAPEKEIKPKTGPTVIQNSNASIISRNPSLISSTPVSKPLKKEVAKVFNKDTTSNKSATSTEKSLSSNKSYPTNSSVKSAHNTVSLGKTPKEYISKSPRATVSSKLRKTETQKRRNLFFELDTIKMSEFLFK